ncbi:orp1 [Hirsutella rhossiliensis]|uniref:Orp1 n=1 Tax=Hirsutella rhossiliensis TaxID=111463 RepID=A0A9P8MNM7_9HYPO|nr:orp1 [Hirsutella rhossiliensis]KAH0958329.1 orp1 [Hirsutella rhossiliensis]
MDVTLLLNQSAGLAGCKEASRESTPSYAVGGPSTAPSTALPTPSPDRSFPQREGETRQSRSRTPWSAGGYSLPLHSDTKFRSASTFSFRSASEQVDSDASYQTTTGADMHSRTGSIDSDMTSSQEPSSVARPLPTRAPSWDERRAVDGEPSIPPRHKFSDSHSSLSSYGSWQSRSHSRISSVTTISGSHIGGLSLAELPILESKDAERDDLKPNAPYGDEQSRFPAVAKHQPPALVLDTAQLERPGSPSDAVLNMKGLARAQQNPDGPRHSQKPRISAFQSSHSSVFLSEAAQKGDFGSRLRIGPMAVSATSPSGARRVSAAGPAAARDRRELADLRESDSDPRDRKPSVVQTTSGRMNSSPDLASQAPMQTLPADDKIKALKGEDGEPRCMFVANCDTGSQLRKAISHLFGRNKSCTLKIPKEVWVYYCRKHYQRIRYRNARTYPSNQMELVKVQIRRLQTWSESNQAKGEAPYIKQWTLSLRKREQNRLENGKATADEGDEDQAAAQGGSVVPDWIIQLVGDGYTTEKMLEIAERLHKDIAEGLLSQVPEIEFLPDIVDDDEGASAKPARTRRQNSSNGGSKTPKRKAADFGTMSRQNSLTGEGASPEHAADEDEAISGLVSPFGKRARIDRMSDAHASSSDVALARPMPGYAAPTYNDGRWGSSVPPRAPKVVPTIRPLEYNMSRGQQREPDHAGRTHFRGFHSMGGGHVNAAFYADPRLTLPSIGAQMSAGANAHQAPMAHPVSGTRAGRHGGSRASHQRSASAFTLATRPMPASTRPSSSGNSAQAALSVGVGMYELGSHNSQSFHGSHMAGQPYHEEAGWATNYTPAYGPQRHVFHHPAMYGPAHCQDTVSPRSGASSSYGLSGASPTFHEAGSGV